VPDTDDEFYENDESEDSDSSSDSNISDNKDDNKDENKSSMTTASISTQLKRRHSESEDNPTTTRDDVSTGTDTADMGQVKRLDNEADIDIKPPQSLATVADGEPVDTKRLKLEDSSSTNEPTTSAKVNSHGNEQCFDFMRDDHCTWACHFSLAFSW